MTESEYKERVQQIERDHRMELRLLAKEFAMSNNPYKVGDVIADHMNRVRIEAITPIMGRCSGLPTCTYSGPALKKDGTPRKDGRIATIWQQNIRKE